jgi:L-ascorbate metabolism protein UlaG (beta-lactamase superfamily)
VELSRTRASAIDRGQIVQDLGYLVEVASIKLLHIGDADATFARFARFRLPARRIDLAPLPGGSSRRRRLAT